jgi:hypothetical protein
MTIPFTATPDIPSVTGKLKKKKNQKKKKKQAQNIPFHDNYFPSCPFGGMRGVGFVSNHPTHGRQGFGLQTSAFYSDFV